VWQFTAEGAIASSPQIANGLIYFGSFDTNVYALNAATGKKVWAFSTSNWVWADPLIVGNLLVIGSLDHNVYALDAATGRVVQLLDIGLRAVSTGRRAVRAVGPLFLLLVCHTLTPSKRVLGDPSRAIAGGLPTRRRAALTDLYPAAGARVRLSPNLWAIEPGRAVGNDVGLDVGRGIVTLKASP